MGRVLTLGPSLLLAAFKVWGLWALWCALWQ